MDAPAEARGWRGLIYGAIVHGERWDDDGSRWITLHIDGFGGRYPIELTENDAAVRRPTSDAVREGLNLARRRGSSAGLDAKAGEWQLDRIVKSKVKGARVLYRCRWVGYGAADDTWEPPAHVPQFLIEVHGLGPTAAIFGYALPVVCC